MVPDRAPEAVEVVGRPAQELVIPGEAEPALAPEPVEVGADAGRGPHVGVGCPEDRGHWHRFDHARRPSVCSDRCSRGRCPPCSLRWSPEVPRCRLPARSPSSTCPTSRGRSSCPMACPRSRRWPPTSTRMARRSSCDSWPETTERSGSRPGCRVARAGCSWRPRRWPCRDKLGRARPPTLDVRCDSSSGRSAGEIGSRSCASRCSRDRRMNASAASSSMTLSSIGTRSASRTSTIRHSPPVDPLSPTRCTSSISTETGPTSCSPRTSSPRSTMPAA